LFKFKQRAFIIIKIRKALEKHTKDDDERRSLTDSELLQQIEKRLEQTNQQRVKQVLYIVKLNLGEKIKTKRFRIKEADLLFGTK